MIRATIAVRAIEESWSCFDDQAPLVVSPAAVGDGDAGELLDEDGMLAAIALGGTDGEAAGELIDDTARLDEGVVSTGVDEGLGAIGGEGVAERDGLEDAGDDEGVADPEAEAEGDDPPMIVNSGLMFPESPMSAMM